MISTVVVKDPFASKWDIHSVTYVHIVIYISGVNSTMCNSQITQGSPNS